MDFKRLLNLFFVEICIYFEIKWILILETEFKITGSK